MAPALTTTVMSMDEDPKPVIGIIHPPPDIRNIIDKTAAFVARNGIQFEERIRENEKHNPKFVFLKSTDPYHAYYQYKIQEAKEGKSTKKLNKIDKSDEEQIKPVTKELPKEPPPFEFMVDMPAISAQDLDILKLTAQFVARNGRSFMNQLAQREARNYQFDFLRPSHSLFNYFTKLVEQYTKVLLPQKDMQRRLHDNVEDKYKVLARIKDRVEWVAYTEAEKRKKEDEDEKERELYAQVDWHDFVIVETVEFTEADEVMELPPPMSLLELENMTLAQKKAAAMGMAIPDGGQEGRGGGDEMDIEDVDMDEDEDEKPTMIEIQPPNAAGPMKIVKDYIPKANQGQIKRTIDEPTQICPRCGQAIPVSEMDEHVRIELLDPKWKEQKLAMEAKKKESNLLQEGTDVAKILKNLSGHRTDIFGSEETAIGKNIREEEERKRREKERVVWDGHTASINLATQRAAQGVSIDEQIAMIHRNKGLTADSTADGIGPRVQPPREQMMDPNFMQGATQQPPSFPMQSVPIYGQYQAPPMSGPIPPRPPAVYAGYPQQHGGPTPFSHQIPGYGGYPPRPGMPLTSGPPQPPASYIPMPGSSDAPRPPMPPSGLSMLPSPFPPTAPPPSISPAEKQGRPLDEEPSGVPTPEPKRQRVEPGSVPESDWLVTHPDPVTLHIDVTPIRGESGSWQLPETPTLVLEDLPLTTLISTLKDKIAARIGMPVGRQKVSIGNLVLKNNATLASYNLDHGGVIMLALKDRGKK